MMEKYDGTSGNDIRIPNLARQCSNELKIVFAVVHTLPLTRKSATKLDKKLIIFACSIASCVPKPLSTERPQ